MTIQLEQAWFGEGLLWKRLIIRELFGEIQGILKDATPSYLADRFIDLSHAVTLDEAIAELRQIDSEYYDELTLYAEEG